MSNKQEEFQEKIKILDLYDVLIKDFFELSSKYLPGPLKNAKNETLESANLNAKKKYTLEQLEDKYFFQTGAMNHLFHYLKESNSRNKNDNSFELIGTLFYSAGQLTQKVYDGFTTKGYYSLIIYGYCCLEYFCYLYKKDANSEFPKNYFNTDNYINFNKYLKDKDLSEMIKNVYNTFKDNIYPGNKKVKNENTKALINHFLNSMNNHNFKVDCELYIEKQKMKLSKREQKRQKKNKEEEKKIPENEEKQEQTENRNIQGKTKEEEEKKEEKEVEVKKEEAKENEEEKQDINEEEEEKIKKSEEEKKEETKDEVTKEVDIKEDKKKTEEAEEEEKKEKIEEDKEKNEESQDNREKNEESKEEGKKEENIDDETSAEKMKPKHEENELNIKNIKNEQHAQENRDKDTTTDNSEHKSKAEPKKDETNIINKENEILCDKNEDELKLEKINNVDNYSNNDNKINLNKMEAKPDSEDKNELNLENMKTIKESIVSDQTISENIKKAFNLIFDLQTKQEEKNKQLEKEIKNLEIKNKILMDNQKKMWNYLNLLANGRDMIKSIIFYLYEYFGLKEQGDKKETFTQLTEIYAKLKTNEFDSKLNNLNKETLLHFLELLLFHKNFLNKVLHRQFAIVDIENEKNDESNLKLGAEYSFNSFFENLEFFVENTIKANDIQKLIDQAYKEYMTDENLPEGLKYEEGKIFKKAEENYIPVMAKSDIELVFNFLNEIEIDSEKFGKLCEAKTWDKAESSEFIPTPTFYNSTKI